MNMEAEHKSRQQRLRSLKVAKLLSSTFSSVQICFTTDMTNPASTQHPCTLQCPDTDVLSGSHRTCTTASQKTAGAGFRHRAARTGACAASTSAAVAPGPTGGSTANSAAPTRPPAGSSK